MKKRQFQKMLLFIALCLSSLLQAHADNAPQQKHIFVAAGETVVLDPMSLVSSDHQSGTITDIEYYLYDSYGRLTNKDNPPSSFSNEYLLFNYYYSRFKFSVTGLKNDESNSININVRFTINNGNDKWDVHIIYFIHVTSSILPDNFPIYTEETDKLQAESEGTLTNLTWNSSNASVVKVISMEQNSSTLEGVSVGSAQISISGKILMPLPWASSYANFSTHCDVTVKSSKKTVNVSTAGTLSNYINEEEKYHIKDLTIKGIVNSTDFRLLRDMAGNDCFGIRTDGRLSVLDLREANIIAGGEKYLETDFLVNMGGNFNYSVEENDNIPEYLFCGCILTKIYLPNETKAIKKYALAHCSNLNTVILPEGLEQIQSSSFFSSGLTSIDIPKSVEVIDKNPFSACRKFSTINVADGNQHFISINGVLFDKSKTILKVYPTDKSGENYIIPSSVKEIGSSAFIYNSSLKDVVLPEGLTTIANWAFSNCKLTKIELPSSVNQIGYGAFRESNDLMTITSNISQPFNLHDAEEIATFSVYQTATLYVPYDTKIAYQQATGWKNFQNIVEMEPTTVSVNQITLNAQNKEIAEGQTFQLSATVLPSNATNKDVTWSSNNTSVATVNNHGLVTGVGVGNAVITCQAQDGSGVKSTCNVTVNASTGLVTQITLNATSKTINKGDTYQLSATISPSNAANKNVTWSSDKPSVATVDNNGLVTGVGGGDAVITCEAQDGSGVKATCNVKVEVLATEMTLNASNIVLTVGQTFRLSKTVVPSDATYNRVKWSSDNTSVATVTQFVLPSVASSTESGTIFVVQGNPGGLVTAHAPGSAIITCLVQDGSGVTATCNVTVKESTGDIIQFADAEVKRICVENWDMDGDDELSEDEAAAVTSIETVFRNNKTIESFTELEYFTGLTTISDWAFGSCSSLRTITFPSSLTSIGSFVFYGSNALTAITIPKSVTSIGEEMLEYTEGLGSIIVESGNTVYDSRNGCNAIIQTATNTLIAGCKNSTIPNSVTSIGKKAFALCSNLASISIPSSVKSIGEYAFQQCKSLSSITLPSGITRIEQGTFYVCSSLATANIPNGVTMIGDRAFWGCGFTNIELPSTLKTISSSAFYQCKSLTSVDIPEGVTSIGSYAFGFCDALSSISIPKSVTSIAQHAFRFCPSLTEVTSYINPPYNITDDVFEVYDDNYNIVFTSATLYVPAGTKTKYQAAAGWTNFQNIVEMGADAVSGDANGDGSVNVTDYLAVANYILGLNYSNFNVTASDVNGDGDVNVTDYVGVANIILYGRSQGTSVNAMMALNADESSTWMEMEPTKDGKINLLLHNVKPFSAFQMDIQLPEGMEIVEVSMAKANQTKNLGYTRLQNGTWRLLYGTLENKAINLLDNTLLTLELAYSKSNAGGFVTIDHIFLVKSDTSTIQLDAVQGGLPTGIYAIESQSSIDGDCYDLTGRKVDNSQLRKGVYVVNGKKLYVK